MLHNTEEQDFLASHVRKAEKNDLNYLLQIEKECFPIPYSEEGCKSLLKNSDVYLLICKSETVGYAALKIIPPEAELWRFAIRPKWQRKKFGHYLWNFIEEILLKKEIQKVYLEVSQNNQAAISFYKKCGFNQYHIRKNYYDTQNHALCLEKALYSLLDNQKEKDGKEYG